MSEKTTTFERTRKIKKFENTETTNGFREVKTEKFLDTKSNLEFDFTLQSLNIDVMNNTMTVKGVKKWYDNENNVFKKKTYTYVDYDKEGVYELVEVVDFETGEVLEVLSETKLEDEFTPVTNWDNNLGETIGNAIINRFKTLNNL